MNKQEDCNKKMTIFDAVTGNDLSALKECLDAGADPNLRTRYGETPLMFVRSLEAARLLVRAGADVNAKSSEGLTAIRDAVASSNARTDIIKYLLSVGADPNARMPDRYDQVTLLQHGLANDCSLEVVRLLVEAGADIQACDSYGNSALDYVFFERSHFDKNIIAYLLSVGMDPNLEDERGKTPLMKAASSENVAEAVRILIEWEADPNVVNTLGETAHYAAYSAGNREAIKLFEECGAALACGSPLHLAIVTGDLESAMALMECEENVNSVDGNHKTPLHLAVFVGLEDIVEALLDRGADPFGDAVRWALRKGNVKVLQKICDRLGSFSFSNDPYGSKPNSSWGCSAPLHEAAETGNSSVVEYLISKGVDVNMDYKHLSPFLSGQTPLEVALSNGHLEMVKTLVKFGAHPVGRRFEFVRLLNEWDWDIQAHDSEGQTALHFVVTNSPPQRRIIDYLLSLGADPNAADNYGITPLMAAMQFGSSLDTVPILIEAGVDVNKRDNEGKTALHWAAQYVYDTPETIRFLLQNGANTALMDRYGDTPLKIAQAYERKDVIEILKIYEAE